MSQSTNGQADGSKAGQQNFPLFYKQPEPLRSDVHANMRLQSTGDYGFARNTNSIPLTIGELPLACRHYPIVFVGQETPMPVAIVGLRKDENLMVKEDGSWADGFYIPAYVRRYPFAFVQGGDKSRFALCIDFGSGMVSENADVALFDNGEPSEITQKALKFCEALQLQFKATTTIGTLLAENGLLEQHSGKFTLESGEQLGLTGLQIVSEKSLGEMEDQTFLALRKNGVHGAIMCHQISMNNWRDLTRRA